MQLASLNAVSAPAVLQYSWVYPAGRGTASPDLKCGVEMDVPEVEDPTEHITIVDNAKVVFADGIVGHDMVTTKDSVIKRKDTTLLKNRPDLRRAYMPNGWNKRYNRVVKNVKLSK